MSPILRHACLGALFLAVPSGLLSAEGPPAARVPPSPRPTYRPPTYRPPSLSSPTIPRLTPWSPTMPRYAYAAPGVRPIPTPVMKSSHKKGLLEARAKVSPAARGAIDRALAGKALTDEERALLRGAIEKCPELTAAQKAGLAEALLEDADRHPFTFVPVGEWEAALVPVPTFDPGVTSTVTPFGEDFTTTSTLGSVSPHTAAFATTLVPDSVTGTVAQYEPGRPKPPLPRPRRRSSGAERIADGSGKSVIVLRPPRSAPAERPSPRLASVAGAAKAPARVPAAAKAAPGKRGEKEWGVKYLKVSNRYDRTITVFVNADGLERPLSWTLPADAEATLSYDAFALLAFKEVVVWAESEGKTWEAHKTTPLVLVRAPYRAGDIQSHVLTFR